MSKDFTEKQVGILFFVFGISQCIFIAPAGYFLDYSNNKITWVIWSSISISVLAVFTAILAKSEGANMWLMIILKFLQGTATAFLPPGFNGITLGIVGSTGFTHQVSRNKMMNHVGTALVVAVASLIAYFMYPNMGLLFITSPLACIGFIYHILRIKPADVNLDAASSLILKSPTMTEYETMDEQQEIAEMMSQAEGTDHGGVLFDESQSEMDDEFPKYNPPTEDNMEEENVIAIESTLKSEGTFSPSNINIANEILKKGKTSWSDFKQRRAESPFAVLIDRNLVCFTVIFFLFHLANSAILPLVMQSLAFDDTRQHLLMSGLCIMIAQTFMMFFAKISGDYSPIWGRKGLFLVALFSLPVRCGILVVLLTLKPNIITPTGIKILNGFMLSTQVLDAVGAGISGTLYIIVTNDISGGTGRFSLMMGVTSGAMCLGCTISGYIGQALAEDYGYRAAILILGLISLLPAFLYLFFMPETLPKYVKSAPLKRRRRLISLFLEINRQRKAVFAKNAKKFSAKFGKRRAGKNGENQTNQVSPSNNFVPDTVTHDEVNGSDDDPTNYVKMV